MAKTNTAVKVVLNEVVGSSNIAGYSQTGITPTTKGELIIKFNNGGVYSYSNVDYETLQGFINAESKGKYFSANIRNKFVTEKVE